VTRTLHRLLAPLLLTGAVLLLLVPPGQGRHAPVPPLRRQFTNSIGMKLVRFPAGKFLMGSPRDESGRAANEEQHEVEISRSFALGACEVTQEQYQKVTGNNPSYFSLSGAGRAQVAKLDTRPFPVERVSWHEAVAFCKQLSELPAEKAARRVYRLPTEAEWEYAGRGRAREYTPFALGRTLASTQANFGGSTAWGPPPGPALKRTCPVGSYKPSAAGLYDVHGNVWEWCSDWYDGTYYARSPRKDPQGPPSGSSRVARGGAWFNPAQFLRSAYRGYATPATRGYGIGLRVVCVSGSR
jgi:formylglycine-generating enzyme required for sulfatase activity